MERLIKDLITEEATAVSAQYRRVSSR